MNDKIVLFTTEAQLPRIARLRDGRNAYRRERGLTNYGGDRTEEEWFRQYDLNAISEIVPGDHLGLPVNEDPRRNMLEPDLKVLEVRGRWNTGFSQLPVRPVDKNMHLPYLLARVDLDRRRVVLVGWLLGLEAKWLAELQPDNAWWNVKSGCWYVPDEHLHSMASLLDWLWVGAPTHTWKPPEWSPTHNSL